MSASGPLPNFYAIYLLPWVLMSRPILRFWGLENERHRLGLVDGEIALAGSSVGVGTPEGLADEETLSPEEEVRLLHILE